MLMLLDLLNCSLDVSHNVIDALVVAIWYYSKIMDDLFMKYVYVVVSFPVGAIAPTKAAGDHRHF